MQSAEGVTCIAWPRPMWRGTGESLEPEFRRSSRIKLECLTTVYNNFEQTMNTD